MLIIDVFKIVLGYLAADWPLLLIGTLIAVMIKVYVNNQVFQDYIKGNSKLSIAGSISFGAFTPLCACGTTAVILSMILTTMPWGPLMAFLVSSPLTSPSEFVFQSAFFGNEFALAVLIASIVLGMGAGLFANLLQKKSNFFDDQFRLKDKGTTRNDNDLTEFDIVLNEKNVSWTKKAKLKEFVYEFYNLGIKKVLLYFVIFIAIGAVINILIPSSWIVSLFGEGNKFSIPLSATLGLPIYVSGSAALPLMRSFMSEGATQGALLAFLITGKATGVPVIIGLSTILKKRAIAFYVGFVYLGGIAAGLVYQAISGGIM